MKHTFYLALTLIIGLSCWACTSSDVDSDPSNEAGETSGATPDDSDTEDTCASGVIDACGVCDGDDSTCAGCDGVANSGLVNDECGECGGDNSTCAGCDGVANSGAVEDACGVCEGDGSTCPPMTDASVLIGQPFLVNLIDATWVQPAGIGSMIGTQLQGLGLVMVALEESDLDSGIMHAAVLSTELVPAEEGDEDAEPTMTQDLCVPTPVVTAGEDQTIGTEDDIGGTWTDPSIDIGPTNLTVFAQGQTVTATGVEMRGVFSDDGTRLTNGRVVGKIDLRSIAAGMGTTPEGACQTVRAVGIVCEECGEANPGVYCIGAVIEDVTSEALTNFEPTIRTCDDIVADEACAETIPSICTQPETL
jgi:hypothetical protein